jgi:hypothetical protein
MKGWKGGACLGEELEEGSEAKANRGRLRKLGRSRRRGLRDRRP